MASLRSDKYGSSISSSYTIHSNANTVSSDYCLNGVGVTSVKPDETKVCIDIDKIAVRGNSWDAVSSGISVQDYIEQVVSKELEDKISQQLMKKLGYEDYTISQYEEPNWEELKLLI